MQTRIFLPLLLLAALLCRPAAAQTADDPQTESEQTLREYHVAEVPNVYEDDYRARVSDPSHILADATRDAIDHIFTRLEDSTGIQACVVMLPSIGQADIFDFAHNLFAHWGVGRRKDGDNGLLILYVADQRKIRFHVGYGLEGLLPDAICKRIQTQQMVPAFKAGDTDTGMLQGARAVAQALEEATNPNRDDSGEAVGAAAALIVLAGMFVLFLLLIRAARRKALTCPKCGTPGALKKKKSDTWRDSAGQRHRRTTYICTACGATETKDTVEDDDSDDPMLFVPGAGRSFSGRGFSGGSSFSGGSFGGGRSGGGGATSGW